MDSVVHVLISLHKGYGLGDAVQVSSVLRHVRKYRPNWVVDFQAEPGREAVGRGIARNVFCYGQPYPSAHYDAEVQIVLYDTLANWHDRPNTRVTSCLHEKFGLAWDAACGRYEVNVAPEVVHSVKYLVPPRSVLLHYQGDSAKGRKDLSDAQASAVCEHIASLGRTPLILDWRGACKLQRARVTHATWGGRADANCAVISQCEAFVGIDSGPSKCASATDTPACVVWAGHHPAPFHDPAPNTTHFVPDGYHGLHPVCSEGVVRFFEANYTVQKYADPVEGVKSWLDKTLKR